MKNYNSYLKIPMALVAIPLLFACGGGEGNIGSKVTEIDSSEDSTLILHEDQIENANEMPDFNPGNAVQVEMGDAGNFNWEEFKNELSAKEEAIGEGFHMAEKEVASSWQKLNDQYSYQTVYQYQNGKLWLQTFYKENNATSGADSLSNKEGTLLTKSKAQNPEFQDLWKKMEEKAKNLMDR